jgi:hypothetical protein
MDGQRASICIVTKAEIIKMKTEGVRIEYIQNKIPFKEIEEYVAVFNGSKESFNLKGWQLIYEDLITGEDIHTHYFYKLRGSFDPGERLCILSAEGQDHFRNEGEEEDFPGAHWDLFTDHPLQIMTSSRVRVRLIDEKGNVIDAMKIERQNDDSFVVNAISVFIGHGGDPQWRDLRDHLQDQHEIRVIAYEIGPKAGLSVKEVLENMLDESSIAFLVLTGEDVDQEGEAHARENVVHELGLFQGRLGFTRAITLLEAEVKEFSNILGVNQIRFDKGRIRETFGDVLATIGREFGETGKEN